MKKLLFILLGLLSLISTSWAASQVTIQGPKRNDPSAEVESTTKGLKSYITNLSDYQIIPGPAPASLLANTTYISSILQLEDLRQAKRLLLVCTWLASDSASVKLGFTFHNGITDSWTGNVTALMPHKAPAILDTLAVYPPKPLSCYVYGSRTPPSGWTLAELSQTWQIPAFSSGIVLDITAMYPDAVPGYFGWQVHNMSASALGSFVSYLVWSR